MHTGSVVGVWEGVEVGCKVEAVPVEGWVCGGKDDVVEGASG